MNKIGFIINGVNYKVDFTVGCKKALEYNYVDKYSISGSIMSVGERLNDMEHMERFIVIDRLFGMALVCNMDRNTNCIEVLAAVKENKVFVKEGVEMYEFNEWAKK